MAETKTDAPADAARGAQAPAMWPVVVMLIPLAAVVIVWLYTGWREIRREWKGKDGIENVVLGDLGNLSWTRRKLPARASPFDRTEVKAERRFAGFGFEHEVLPSTDFYVKRWTAPFWSLLVVAFIPAAIAVGVRQRKLKRMNKSAPPAAADAGGPA